MEHRIGGQGWDIWFGSWPRTILRLWPSDLSLFSKARLSLQDREGKMWMASAL